MERQLVKVAQSEEVNLHFSAFFAIQSVAKAAHLFQ